MPILRTDIGLPTMFGHVWSSIRVNLRWFERRLILFCNAETRLVTCRDLGCSEVLRSGPWWPLAHSTSAADLLMNAAYCPRQVHNQRSFEHDLVIVGSQRGSIWSEDTPGFVIVWPYQFFSVVSAEFICLALGYLCRLLVTELHASCLLFGSCTTFGMDI